MTKIKMLARYATPDIMAAPGQIVNVTEYVAHDLISQGYAVLVAGPETAMLDKTTETAVAPQKVVKKKR